MFLTWTFLLQASIWLSVLLSLQPIHIIKWKWLLLEHWGREGFILRLPTSYMRLYFPSEWTMCYNCPLLYLPPQSVRLVFSPYTSTLCLSVWRWKYESKIYSSQSQYSDKARKLGVFFPLWNKVQKGSRYRAKNHLACRPASHTWLQWCQLQLMSYTYSCWSQATWSEETYVAYQSNLRKMNYWTDTQPKPLSKVIHIMYYCGLMWFLSHGFTTEFAPGIKIHSHPLKTSGWTIIQA